MKYIFPNLRVIEKYWDDTIDDDGFFARRRRAKTAPRDPSAANEAERKMKGSVHEVLKRYADDFGDCGISLKVEFSYGGEIKRPNNNYIFEMSLTLCGTRKDDLVTFELPLLKVIRGKKEYRPKVLKDALSEIEAVLAEELKNLRENGYAKYYEEV